MHNDVQKVIERCVNENNIVIQSKLASKGARISDHILTIKTLVNKYAGDQKGKKLYACFVDFKKAFDFVPQVLLSQNFQTKT